MAQADSAIAQVSTSASEAFAGGISGDGRFVVFESNGNVATEDPRNADNNTEIFIFDYAQRRIFQITDTKSVLFNTVAPATFDNIRVTIINTRPVISNDGRWVAFSSNATTARASSPNATNPGSFDGNLFTSPTPTPSPTPTGTPTPTPTGTPAPSPTPPANPLTADGNLEMWLYQIPNVTAVASLSAGDELPVTNLAGGTFIRVTNTDPSQLPLPGSNTTGPFVADDNHDASISDDGGVVAFVSTRDLVPAVGNVFPADDNDEIFTFVRATSTLGQVTKTPRGPIGNPNYSKNPTISGNGRRVAFTSSGENPIVGMTGGVNPSTSRNEEIFVSDIDAAGATTGLRRQVTATTPLNPGDAVNVLDLGRRMSRDGRFIAFDSFADLANENSGTNYTSFALYLYDVTGNNFRRIGPRSDADTAATGGDVTHYPGFTDYDVNGVPTNLVFASRLNLKADGTIPTTAADGLNPGALRSTQLYSYPINVPAAMATLTRLAKFPDPVTFVASTQFLTSNTLVRGAFNIALTEFGTGNLDLQSEVFYYLKPTVTAEPIAGISLFTGATRLPILPTATPSGSITPTPTPSPTATATPTPTATPTGSPTVTPTPVTPAAVLGISPGMLAVADYTGSDVTIAPRTAVSSLLRRPTLPIELSGVSMTINGAACGLKSVGGRRIEFVVPPALTSAIGGTVFPVVINNNGVELKTFLTIVPTRPDIFRNDFLPQPLGRARLFNVTNTVQTTEPFVVRTIRRRGNLLSPSRIRIFLTGVEGVTTGAVSVRIRDVVINVPNIRTNATLVEPGVYTIDFDLPASLDMAGDQPIVVSVTVGGSVFSSRLDDTTSRIFLL
ncbi:MAG: hypothetical protein WKF34_11605 [Pyrinomonadaceae bacterium]